MDSLSVPSSSQNKCGGGKPVSFRPLDQQELRFDNVEHLMHVHGRYHELSDVQKEQMMILEKKYMKLNEFPNDRFNPFFYHVYSHTLPQEHHYRVVPKDKDVMVHNAAELKQVKGRSRHIMEGWNNYTDYEKEQIEKTKELLREHYGIDLSHAKEFGPRNEEGKVVLGAEKPLDGWDYHFSDANILRYISGWNFDLLKSCEDIRNHLQWRQTNIPVPILTDKTLAILNKGIFYIHGRCFDGSPIVIFDMKLIIDYYKQGLLDQPTLCNYYHFVATYLQRNMLIPGQCEKWVSIININKCNLAKMPINFFKTCVGEVTLNYPDSIKKCFLVNLTWVQSASAKFLLKFCHPFVQQKVFFYSELAPKDLDQYVPQSQREEIFGGTSPNITQYWPPAMPELTESFDENEVGLVSRDEYPKLIEENPGLRVMPKELRAKYNIELNSNIFNGQLVDEKGRSNQQYEFSPQSTATKLTGPISGTFCKFDPLVSQSYLDSNQDELAEHNSINSLKSIEISIGNRRKFRYSTLTN